MPEHDELGMFSVIIVVGFRESLCVWGTPAQHVKVERSILVVVHIVLEWLAAVSGCHVVLANGTPARFDTSSSRGQHIAHRIVCCSDSMYNMLCTRYLWCGWRGKLSSAFRQPKATQPAFGR